MKAPGAHNDMHHLSDVAIDDLRVVCDAVGIDSEVFSQDDLNSIGMMLLTAHMLRLKIESRRMHRNGEDAIIEA